MQKTARFGLEKTNEQPVFPRPKARWRFGAIKQLDNELTKSGLKKYLHKDWKTPQVHPSHRGSEIKMWLDERPEIKNYIILDDDINILDEQTSHLVQTNIEFGMQNGHFIKAREILSASK